VSDAQNYGSNHESNGNPKLRRHFGDDQKAAVIRRRLAGWERSAILDFHDRHPLEGYRRLTFMMLDDDVVAVSPSTVYRILKQAGRLDRKWQTPSKKGIGFVQPLRAHDHWHVDISYINLGGAFYYRCSLLDGYSRFIVHWEIRESMTECDVETIVQRGLEKFPDVRPRIISDNGPQFIARDFKEFIRLTGMTHVRTSPYYPQSRRSGLCPDTQRARQFLSGQSLDLLDWNSLRLPRPTTRAAPDAYPIHITGPTGRLPLLSSHALPLAMRGRTPSPSTSIQARFKNRGRSSDEGTARVRPIAWPKR
jgi:Integrase core domain